MDDISIFKNDKKQRKWFSYIFFNERIKMSYCEQCEHCDKEQHFCNRLDKPLIRCAGGCKFNRKNAISEEELQRIEEERKQKLTPFLDQIICGDSLEIMKKIPDNSVDVIVTSPPYNLRNSTGGSVKYYSNRRDRIEKNALFKSKMLDGNGYDVHSDDMPYDEYIQWQRNCLTEMLRVLKPTGFIFYNHKQRVQAGLLQHRMEILEGFPLRQIITWWRSNTANDINRSYFYNTVEQIFFIAKQRKSYLKKGANKFGLVWKIHPAYDKKKFRHPAPFPIEIPDRCLDSVDLTPDSVVLDPFMGGGTVALSALKHGIHYIGIDLSPGYCQMAQENIINWKIEHSGDNE
jgi:modification methylase